MSRLLLVMTLACALGIAIPAIGADAEKFKPSIPDELGDAWDRFQQVLQDWSGRVRERLGGRESAENRPAISQMLSSKDLLGLSPDQVKKLEQLRDSFQRQSIRNDADLRIVELDIASLLDNPRRSLELSICEIAGRFSADSRPPRRSRTRPLQSCSTC